MHSKEINELVQTTQEATITLNSNNSGQPAEFQSLDYIPVDSPTNIRGTSESSDSVGKHPNQTQSDTAGRPTEVEQTELGFLIELLLNHKLTPVTKKVIQVRIKSVEAKLSNTSQNPTQAIATPNYIVQPSRPLRDPNAQAPSTQAILAKDPSNPLPVRVSIPPSTPISAPQPTTQQAAAALMARQTAIAAATSAGAFTGKPEPGRTAPRKW